MQSKKLIFTFLILFSLTFISALSDENNIYSDCTIYGNCQPVIGGGSTNITNNYNNYTNITANLSNYYQKNETYNQTEINNNLSNYYLKSNPNNYYNSSTLPNQSANLTGYAMLNGSNQPFTGDLNINKSNPCYNMTAQDGTRHSICKYESDGIVYRGGVGGISTFLNTTYGYDAKFDGVDDYGETADSARLEPKANVSWSVWIYPNGPGTNADEAYVFMKGRRAGVPYTHWAMGYMNTSTYAGGTNITNKKVFLYYYNTSSTGPVVSGNVTFRQWSHVVFTKNSTHLALYINGIEFNRTAIVGDIVYNAEPSETLTVGAANFGGIYNRRFDGQVDEFALWNRSLNSTEVSQLYAQGVGLGVQNATAIFNQTTNNAIAGWNFNENSGSIYIDVLSRQHNLTLNNGATWNQSGVNYSSVNITSGTVTNLTYLNVSSGTNATYDSTITFGTNNSNLTIKSYNTWWNGIVTFFNETIFNRRATFSSGINVTGESTFNSGINVTGESTFNSGINVTGESTFNNNTRFNQNLSVQTIVETGQAFINGTLTNTSVTRTICDADLGALTVKYWNVTYINGRLINTTTCV